MVIAAMKPLGGTALRYSEFFTMLQNELSEEFKNQYPGRLSD
jgi:AraC family transcriptional regulator